MTSSQARELAIDAFGCGFSSCVCCLNERKANSFILGCSNPGKFLSCQDCGWWFVVVDGDRSPNEYSRARNWLQEKIASYVTA